jgi:hypothetical protein
MRYPRAFTGQSGGGDRTIDAAADDQDIVDTLLQFLNVALT